MDKFKYRIVEKVYDNYSEFHPQLSHDGKEWHSLLIGTKDFERGVSFKKAEKLISQIKRGKIKPTKEIIHER